VRSRSRKIPPAAPSADAGQAATAPAFGRAATATEPGSAPESRVNGSAAAAPGTQARPPAREGEKKPPSRRALRNWRVRSRLLLLITIPTLTAVALGGIRIASSVQSALAYQRVLQLATLSSDITVLAQRLEDERDQTVYYIALDTNGGRSSAIYGANTAAQRAAKATGLQELKVVQDQVAQTNQAMKVVTAELAQIGGSFPSQVRQEAAIALSQLGTVLTSLRSAATTTSIPALTVVTKYTGIIDNLLVLEDATAQGANDPALAQTVRQLGLVAQMQEDASQQRAILAAALIQQNLSPNELQALTLAESDQKVNEQEFKLTATGAQRQNFESAGVGQVAFQAKADELSATSLQSTTGSLKTDSTTPDDWYGAMSHTITYQMGSVERQLVGEITSRATTLRNQAVTIAIITGLAVLFVLALALFFTVVVARSMVRPLRRLRAGALEVAGVRLPETVRSMSEGEGADGALELEPIDVDSTDEIGEVARAFDQVHREAVRLAANEAALRGNVNAMFVNLSRRSQSLVERQIRLIDDLEQGEQDAERLGNLFQMDHLATRMRRNSENLLVLAGHEVSRRWTQAVALVDVLRAAVSEIEQYNRVTLNVQPGISVRGQAVNDVVHLLAELVENATSFSAAETPVNVSGHLLNSGGVLLDISDQGVGMGAEEMAHANWRLDNPPVVDVAVSRRMGLFVVARLAARHGIRVRLRPAQMGGLTALVWLPDEVITHETAAAPGGGLRRFEVPTPAAGTPGLGSGLGSGLGDWSGGSTPDDRSAAVQAVTAARAPRFAPLRPDLGETDSFAAIGAGTSPPAGAGTDEPAAGVTAAAPEPAENDEDTGVMPAASEADSLPVFAAPLTGPRAGSPLSGGPLSGGPLSGGPVSGDPLSGGTLSGSSLSGSALSGSAPGGGTAPGGSSLGGPPAGSSPFSIPGGNGPAPSSPPLSVPDQGFDRRAGDLPRPAFGNERNETSLPSQRGVVIPPAAGTGEENRLPIFESVESDWFRRGRHGAERPAVSAPVTDVVSAASTATSSWSSPGDEGWRAAEVASAPVSGGVTGAGLPKRVPKANLVPGGVGAGGGLSVTPAPARSASQTRERLASFQRGIREGRAASFDDDERGEEDSGP
jgi:signal transduction histidine kinase